MPADDGEGYVSGREPLGILPGGVVALADGGRNKKEECHKQSRGTHLLQFKRPFHRVTRLLADLGKETRANDW